MASTKTIAPVTEKFATITPKLAEADVTASVASADSTAARAAKSELATNAILAAFAEKIKTNTVRETLLDAGVLKGTVSKITTVVDALFDKKITADEVKSLNGAYTIVTNLRKAAAAGTVAATTTGIAVTATADPLVSSDPNVTVATTAQQALDLILDTVRNEPNLDKAFKLGGEWTRKITDAMSELLNEREKNEEK